ncbi:MAG: hypothetical protein M1830_000144 [Pleopsidium flavum]|nr:MAG: hypothetical protein M1830_000144 [Pleopsidium flavum]
MERPKQPPIGDRVAAGIAEEIRKREAQARTDKAAENQRLINQSVEEFRRRHSRSGIMVPELEAREVPSQRHRPVSPPTPPLSRIGSASTCEQVIEDMGPGGDGGNVSRLQACLAQQQGQIQTLERDLATSTITIKRLRGEREEAKRQYRQASVSGDAADLKERIARLMEQLDQETEENGRLEDELDKGKARERELGRQLENAMLEIRQLKYDMEKAQRWDGSGSTGILQSLSTDQKQSQVSSQATSRPLKTIHQFRRRRGQGLLKGFEVMTSKV